MYLLICVVIFDMRNLASIRAIHEPALCFQNAGNLKLLQGRRSSSGKRSSFDCDVCGESSFCGGRLSLDCEVCDKFSTSVESEGSFFCSSIMFALSVSLVLIVNGTFMSFLPSDVSFLDVIS